MAYTKKTWKDYPDATTPILASDLNNIENGIENIENNVNNIENGIEALANKYGVISTPDLPSGKIEIVSGVIKQDTTDRTKWYFIDDANHTPIGVAGTYATASGYDLTITFNKTYTKVLSFICGPDETLSKTYNLSTGASVGLNSATINVGGTIRGAGRIYFDGTNWQTAEDTRETLGTTATNTGSNITVTHSFCPGGNIQLTADTGNGTVAPLIPVFRNTVSNTQFRMNFINYAGSFSTTADTTWSCHYSKHYSGPFVLDGTNGWDDIPLNNGNIWFFGIFLV